MFSSRWLLAHYRLSWQRLSPIYCISRLAGRKGAVDMKQKFSYKENRAHHHMFSSGLMTVATKDTGSGSWFTQSYTSEDWKVLVNWTFFYVKQEKRHCHPPSSALILHCTIIQKQEVPHQHYQWANQKKIRYLYITKTSVIFPSNTGLAAKASYFKLRKQILSVSL